MSLAGFYGFLHTKIKKITIYTYDRRELLTRQKIIRDGSSEYQWRDGA
jgi:hypothetical protein